MTTAAMSGVPVALQVAVTTGNGLAIAIPNTFYSHTIEVIGSAGVASGAIQIESASDPAYLGTWSVIGSPVTVTASTETDRSFSGTYAFIRARVSTNVVGGTVSVNYVGSQVSVSGSGSGPSGYPALSTDAAEVLRGDGVFSQTIPGGTVTSSDPWTFSQTWNNVATTFEALKIAITNTLSAAASRLFSITFGGNNAFSIQRDNIGSATAGQVAIVVNEDLSGTSKDYAFHAESNLVDITRGDGALNRQLGIRAVIFFKIPGGGEQHIIIDGEDRSGIQMASNRYVGWAASTTDASTLDSGLYRNAAGVVEVNNGTAGTFADLLARALRSNAVTFANRPSTPVEGMVVAFTDSNTIVWGATIAGSSTNHVLGYYDGTNWTVIGK